MATGEELFLKIRTGSKVIDHAYGKIQADFKADDPACSKIWTAVKADDPVYSKIRTNFKADDPACSKIWTAVKADDPVYSKIRADFKADDPACSGVIDLSHTATKSNWTSCEVCKKHFSDPEILQQCLHTEEEASYSCEDCGSKQTWSRHILKHMLVLSGEMSYLCGVCSLKVSLEGLDNHFHAETKVPSCTVCHKQCTSLEELENHCLCHNQKEKKVRRTVKKKETKNALHVGIENDIKNQLRIRMENELKKYYHHILAQNQLKGTNTGHHEPVKEDVQNKRLKTSHHFVCNDCGQQFKEEEELKSHHLTHTENNNTNDETVILCGICAQEFKDETQVRDHCLIHAKELAQQNESKNQNITRNVFDNQELILAHSNLKKQDTVAKAATCTQGVDLTTHSVRKEQSHSDSNQCTVAADSDSLAKVSEEELLRHSSKHTQVDMPNSDIVKQGPEKPDDSSLVQCFLVKEGDKPVGYSLVVTDPQNPIIVEDEITHQQSQAIINGAKILTNSEPSTVMSHHVYEGNVHVKQESGCCDSELSKLSPEKHLEGHFDRVCEICFSSFMNLEHLRKHSIHNCCFCDSCFCNITSLEKHMLLIHNEKLRYSCEKCGRKYNWLYHLQEHMAIHN